MALSVILLVSSMVFLIYMTTRYILLEPDEPVANTTTSTTTTERMETTTLVAAESDDEYSDADSGSDYDASSDQLRLRQVRTKLRYFTKAHVATTTPSPPFSTVVEKVGETDDDPPSESEPSTLRESSNEKESDSGVIDPGATAKPLTTAANTH